jgi:hypothetical protein
MHIGSGTRSATQTAEGPFGPLLLSTISSNGKPGFTGGHADGRAIVINADPNDLIEKFVFGDSLNAGMKIRIENLLKQYLPNGLLCYQPCPTLNKLREEVPRAAQNAKRIRIYGTKISRVPMTSPFRQSK